jgi:hypothetical protein
MIPALAAEGCFLEFSDFFRRLFTRGTKGQQSIPGFSPRLRTTTARVKKADVMLSERAEFVAAAFSP